MKNYLKALLVLSLLVLNGCIPNELMDKNEENGETFSGESKIQMAWLNDDGSISNQITSNFLLVDDQGIEKSLFRDNYLVSIIDSSDTQHYSLSFFDSNDTYIPTRTVSGNFEFIISNFDDDTFSYDMNIIYPIDENSIHSDETDKKLNQEKGVIRIEKQKFNPEIELSLKKLKEFTFGNSKYEEATKTASYLNTLRVGFNDANKSGMFKLAYEQALKDLENGNSALLNALNRNKDFKRLLGLNWKTNLLKAITTSIAENVITNGDWFGKYNDEISLAFSGAFTVAGCVATLGIGCAIGVIDFGIDAYEYYQKNFIPTHIGFMKYTFQGASDNCGCSNTSMTVDFGNGKTETITNGNIINVALTAGTYDLKLSFTTSSGESRTQSLTVNSDNFSISWYCYCTTPSGKSPQSLNQIISKLATKKN